MGNSKEIVKYQTDYRDTILVNGIDEYIGTGRIVDNRIEFVKKDDSDLFLYLNVNMTANQYIDEHNRFEIIRLKNGRDFSGPMQLNLQDSQKYYCFTGRIFYRADGCQLWENMRENDPSEVIYVVIGKSISEEMFVIGKEAVNIELNKKTKNTIYSKEEFDAWKKTLDLALREKQLGNYNKALEIYENYEKQYPLLNPKLLFSKGKILILLDKLDLASDEFIKIMKYFVRFEKEILESNNNDFIGLFLDSLQHLGYCIADWDDSEEYLSAVRGESNETESFIINMRKRSLLGLKFMEQYGIWCSTFNQLKHNFEKLQ